MQHLPKIDTAHLVKTEISLTKADNTRGKQVIYSRDAGDAGLADGRAKGKIGLQLNKLSFGIVGANNLRWISASRLSYFHHIFISSFIVETFVWPPASIQVKE